MKEPKVKKRDEAKFPKVQYAYENKFKKSYDQFVKGTISEISKILNEKI